MTPYHKRTFNKLIGVITGLLVLIAVGFTTDYTGHQLISHLLLIPAVILIVYGNVLARRLEKIRRSGQ